MNKDNVKSHKKEDKHQHSFEKGKELKVDRGLTDVLHASQKTDSNNTQRSYSNTREQSGSKIHSKMQPFRDDIPKYHGYVKDSSEKVRHDIRKHPDFFGGNDRKRSFSPPRQYYNRRNQEYDRYDSTKRKHNVDQYASNYRDYVPPSYQYKMNVQHDSFTNYRTENFYDASSRTPNFDRKEHIEKQRNEPLVIEYNHLSLKSVVNNQLLKLTRDSLFGVDRREEYWSKDNSNNAKQVTYDKSMNNDINKSYNERPKYNRHENAEFEPENNSRLCDSRNISLRFEDENVLQSQTARNMNVNPLQINPVMQNKTSNQMEWNKQMVGNQMVGNIALGNQNTSQVTETDLNVPENLSWRNRKSTSVDALLNENNVQQSNMGKNLNPNLALGKQQSQGPNKSWNFGQEDAQTKLLNSRKEAIFSTGVNFNINQLTSTEKSCVNKEESEAQKRFEEFHERWLYGRSNAKQPYDTQCDSEKMILDDSEIVIECLPDDAHIDAVDIQVLKKVVNEKALSYADVDDFCIMDAQYFYYKATVGKFFALENAKKKGEKQMMKSYCKTCNLVFAEQQNLDNHYSSKTHQQLERIVKQLHDVAVKWFEAKTYDLSENKEFAEEKDGLTLDLGVNMMRDFSGVADVPIADDFYEEFDLKKLTVKEFVQKASAKRMALVWPKPKLEFFCKICNYIEFSSKDLLDRHLQSTSHQEHQARMKETFCKICQHNFENDYMHYKHLSSDQHRRADRLYEQVRIHATKYWNLMKLNLPEEESRLIMRRSQFAEKEKTEEQKEEEKIKDDQVRTRLFEDKPDEFKLLDNFLTPEGCQLCNKAFPPVNSQIEAHVKSKKHQKKFRQYLADNKDEFLTPGGCVLCEMSFPCVDPVIVAAHRLSKKHMAKRRAYFFGADK